MAIPWANPHQSSNEIEKALAIVADQRGERFAASLRPILFTNLERRRIDYYLKHHAQGQLADYVQRVVDHYERLSPYLDQVQRTKSPEVWEPLFEKLRKWAYHYLKRFPEISANVSQLTSDYATAAAVRILTAHFPYDTEFDPWACILLQNVCREQLRREKKMDSIDDEQLAELPDLTYAGRAQTREDRHELLEAVQLMSSETRREFIVLYYFQGYSLREIADRMNRSMSAIYRLHFDALKELRKILGGSEHKDE